MTVTKLDNSITEENENFAYNELIRSIAETEKGLVLKKLDSNKMAKKAHKLKVKLDNVEKVGFNLEKSRKLFLYALKGVQLKHISAAQLATLHLLDSAIRTLYTNPMTYFIYRYVNSDDEIAQTMNLLLITDLEGMPTSVKRFSYERTLVPTEDTKVSDLPWRMQKPLLRRFFNFTESEWTVFCNEMRHAPKSEQQYHVLNAPEQGCWSSIVSEIQKILICMRVLDWIVPPKNGLYTESIMVVPSFTMFQAALIAKAHTLNRKPIQLIPTYGYIDLEHYAELKTVGKVALTLYLPEKSKSLRYNSKIGNFRNKVDGHPAETAFGGAIHDVYHAMREMAMSENVAKARMRLASIAKTHPKNKSHLDSRAVDEILIDGELIHSYPLEMDTMFDAEYRPSHAEIFGWMFYTPALKKILHADLKYAFIEDMVENKSIWQEQFGLNKTDLLLEDCLVYDEIDTQLSNKVDFSTVQTINQFGLLSARSAASAVVQGSAATQRL